MVLVLNRPMRLGQNGIASWWPAEGQEAIRRFDGLLGRTALVADTDARGDILKWVGRADVPGSPSERYKAVSSSVGEQVLDESILRRRLDQLNASVQEFETMVKNAERAYGTLPAPSGAGSASGSGDWRPCFLGSIALLSLGVIPLLID